MADNSFDSLNGFFTHTLFKAENYMVAKFKTEDGTITVTGPSFDYDKKSEYLISGNYVEHPRYGLQFSISTIERALPSRKSDIIAFLSSRTFKGIGRKAAEKIYEAYGDDTFAILKNDPDLIFSLDLKEKQITSLLEGLKQLSDPHNEIIFHLISNGFTNLEAGRIFNRFELSTLEVGQRNPFSFYNDVYGISFEKVKDYASKIDFSEPDLKYKESFLIFLLTDYFFNTGDTYIEYEDFCSLLNRQGGFEAFAEAFDKALLDDYLVKDGERIYLSTDYRDEMLIADFLSRDNNEMSLSEDLIAEGIMNNESDLGIEYDDLQKQAISSFFRNRVSIIVGGPGTGKTTIVKTMVSIFRNNFPFANLIVVAPTGRAAKRINEVCDCESKTIHSLLKWNKETNTFVHNEDEPIIYDAVIIDEFSMVDNSLFASLLKAGSNIKKICVIGDNNQLPSIRPGNVLRDLIESEKFETTLLKANYRQNKGSEIIELANDIIEANIDLNRFSKDIYYYDHLNSAADLLELIKEDLNNGYTLDDIQVLSPMYRGTLGIDNLNQLLQNAFNPPGYGKAQKKIGQVIYRIDDKILQLKNRPSDDVYNGDIGILQDIDEKENTLMINFDGNYVFYSSEDFQDLTLAYAMSVHKAQGSEYPIVYFVINPNNIRMLNRNLIYTAISRAKNKLVIIGEGSLFIRGCSNMMEQRKTGLKEIITNER